MRTASDDCIRIGRRVTIDGQRWIYDLDVRDVRKENAKEVMSEIKSI